MPVMRESRDYIDVKTAESSVHAEDWVSEDANPLILRTNGGKVRNSVFISLQRSSIFLVVQKARHRRIVLVVADAVAEVREIMRMTVT